MDQFVAIDWQEPSALEGFLGAELSETEFMALTPDKQSAIQSEVWPALKEIAREAVAKGKELEKQGKREEASKYFEATSQLADQLSSESSCKLFQMFGQAISQVLNERPSKLE